MGNRTANAQCAQTAQIVRQGAEEVADLSGNCDYKIGEAITKLISLLLLD
jgi:hypothetical protein